MYSNLGRVYFSDYLDGLKGVEAIGLTTFFNRGAKAIMSNFRSYQAHISAQARIEETINIVHKTGIGRELIEFAAPNKISMALEPTFSQGYANQRGTPSVVRVSPKDPADIQANLAVHELCHDRQDKNVSNRFGHSQIFNRRAIAFADTAYPVLIGEGDAFATQTIQAYELHLQGIKSPWAWHRFLYSKKPLAQALLTQLNKGADLYDDETKRAIFDAWMTVSVSRIGYEAEYLSDIIQKPLIAMRLNEAGLSHKNEDLQSYTANSSGHSYMQGTDITVPTYLGIWGALSSKQEVFSAAIERGKTAYFLSRYIPALEMIDLLEDHFDGHNKWADLPEGHDALSIFDKGEVVMFGKSISQLAKIPEIHDDELGAKQKVIELLDRAQSLLKRHRSLESEGLGSAILEGRKNFEERPKARTRPQLASCDIAR